MKRIEESKSILIKQKRAWGEVITGIEQRNRYFIYDDNGQEIYFAGEQNIKLFWRLMMKSMRPFEIVIVDETGVPQLIIRRPYRWFYHECSIFLPDETLLANVRWEFSFINRKYLIRDSSGGELFKLFGPLFKPWTFRILKFDHQVGLITKKWSGVVKEVFTDEDNFGILFDEPLSLKEKQILLGTVFLVDFVHYERR